MIEFRVWGVSQQMGSKRAFTPKGWNRPIITDSNRSLKGWQVLVRQAASTTLNTLPLASRGLLLGGVRLTLAVVLPRPKSLAKKLSPHLKAPDLDKLVRGLADPLSGLLYRDDSQVVELIASKRYAAVGESPHVDVRVEATQGTAPMRQPAMGRSLWEGLEG